MNDSRQRFLDTTARLIRERGYAATSMGDVVAASGAPRGSLYFHFPGGKEQLVAEALGAAGHATCAAMEAALAQGKAADGLETVVAFLAAELEASDFRVGCPIGTVAAEAPEAPEVRQQVQHAFVAWETVIATRLRRAGLGRKRAGELATFVLAVIEGALVLAKAKKSVAPLDGARREIARILRAEQVS